MRPESRMSLLAKVHIARKDLNLDDDTYRELLHRVTGHESAKDCTVPELVRVVAEFRRKGWQEKPKGGKPRPAPSRGTAALRGKITALLAEAGRPEEYAEGIARRMHKVDALEFCTPKQLKGVIAALVRDAQRHGRVA
ncbi:gp16 family protein [Fundidesulfovibrio agrisoli]|uniref:gp16 family protein n=1 Tax=Fundidesulfovibrio agrisoli TaxID=2922717 RepID=UPI001FAC7F3C|nr:regulatory protein GemA [Fundidesulfovibrio agrisoli]